MTPDTTGTKIGIPPAEPDVEGSPGTAERGSSSAPVPPGAEGISRSPRPLLDGEILAKAGREGTSEPPEVSFRAGGLKYTTYLYRLKDQIEYVWKYPDREGRLGIEGDLLIRFEILKDGSLGRIELVRTSGYPALDEAAMRALRDAAPFYPLPQKWDMDTFRITGHFVYHAGRSYIR